MTGLFPSQHGVYHVEQHEIYKRALGRTGSGGVKVNSLREGVETFAEKLQEAGYDLYYSGKWRVSDTEMPADRGWNELQVSPHIRDRNHRQNNGISGHPPVVRKTVAEQIESGKVRLYGTLDEGGKPNGDRKIVQMAMERLRSLKDSPNPWCLYIGVNGPHSPFEIPKKYAEMYDPEQLPLPQSYYDTSSNKPGAYLKMKEAWKQLTEREFREAIAHYWGYNTLIDEVFGEVLEVLDHIGKTDETMVIFLSDHGEHAGAHGMFFKGMSAYDEGYRIPCVMRWPNGIQNPGRTVDRLVMMMDIAPTILEVAGAQPLHHCIGESLIPFLKDENFIDWRSSIYLQCDGMEPLNAQRVVQTLDYKYVYRPSEMNELYDLKDDPYEMQNLIHDPDHEQVKRDLYYRLQRHAADAGELQELFSNNGSG
ncbi:MAG: sulfatase [Paenibacillaceae bacterium]|nr:sulfatase [Paenibacillaceae bacterium]